MSQIEQGKALQSQHRCYPSEASGVIQNRLGDPKNQSHRAAGKMGGGQRGSQPPRAPLYAKNRSFQDHKLSPQ